MKHPRNSATQLYRPPQGTEDNLAAGNALVPLDVPARGSAELDVEERQPMSRAVDWLSPLADDAVQGYLGNVRADPAIVSMLRAAWETRRILVRAVEERRKLSDEQNEIARATEETRNNLKVLEKNKTAGDLRDQLAARLAKWSLRLDQITKRLVELDMAINEQRVRFTESVRGIKLIDTDALR